MNKTIIILDFTRLILLLVVAGLFGVYGSLANVYHLSFALAFIMTVYYGGETLKSKIRKRLRKEASKGDIIKIIDKESE